MLIRADLGHSHLYPRSQPHFCPHLHPCSHHLTFIDAANRIPLVH